MLPVSQVPVMKLNRLLERINMRIHMYIKAFHFQFAKQYLYSWRNNSACVELLAIIFLLLVKDVATVPAPVLQLQY